jgi:hypothetical protein
MTELVAVPLESGGAIVVEMDDALGGVVKAGRPGEIAGQAAQSLEAALDSVTPAAESIVAKLRKAGPHDVTVEFGLKLTATAGAVITKTTGECNLKVTLLWKGSGGAVS